MFIQIVDGSNVHAPVIRLHSDENEAKRFLVRYKSNLIKWRQSKNYKGMPLARFDATTVTVDLVYHLSKYYLETGLPEWRDDDRIQSWITLWNYEDVKNEKILKLVIR